MKNTIRWKLGASQILCIPPKLEETRSTVDLKLGCLFTSLTLSPLSVQLQQVQVTIFSRVG